MTPAAILAPFVGAKLKPGPRDTAVDIIHGVTESRGADVRAIDGNCVKLFFWDRGELVPFSSIRTIRIRKLDPMGNTLGCETYHFDADRELAA